jgi:hypothetical protein
VTALHAAWKVSQEECEAAGYSPSWVPADVPIAVRLVELIAGAQQRQTVDATAPGIVPVMADPVECFPALDDLPDQGCSPTWVPGKLVAARRRWIAAAQRRVRLPTHVDAAMELAMVAAVEPECSAADLAMADACKVRWLAAEPGADSSEVTPAGLQLAVAVDSVADATANCA